MENNIKCEERKERKERKECQGCQTQINCFYTPSEDERVDIKNIQDILNPYSIPIKLELLTPEGDSKLIYQGVKAIEVFNFLTILKDEDITSPRIIFYLQHCSSSSHDYISSNGNKRMLEITLITRSIYQEMEVDDISNIHIQAQENIISEIKQSLHNVEGLTVEMRWS